MAKTPDETRDKIKREPHSKTADMLATEYGVSARTVKRIRKEAREETAAAVHDELSGLRVESVGSAMGAVAQVRARALLLFLAKGDPRHGMVVVRAASTELRFLVPELPGAEFADLEDDELFAHLQRKLAGFRPGGSGPGADGVGAPPA